MALLMACPCWRRWGLKGAMICSLGAADWPASLSLSLRTLGWLSLIGGLAAKRSQATFVLPLRRKDSGQGVNEYPSLSLLDLAGRSGCAPGAAGAHRAGTPCLTDPVFAPPPFAPGATALA